MDESILAMQRAELESLVSIFGEELLILSDCENPEDPVNTLEPPVRFTITLQPYIQVRFEFPPGYPDTEPLDISVSLLKRTKNLQQGIKALEADLAELSQQLIGSPSALMLLSRCQTFTEDGGEKAAGATQVQDDGDDVDPTIRVGTTCTMEVFQAWKEKFDAEMAARAAATPTTAPSSTAGAVGATGKRPTGKQMFESSLKNADWSLFDGEDLPPEDDL
eukprot:PhF_6_TR37663/c0_g1_i2/m.56047